MSGPMTSRGPHYDGKAFRMRAFDEHSESLAIVSHARGANDVMSICDWS